MKRLLYAVIITCLGAILIGLNNKEHKPPRTEAPVSVQEAPQAPIEPVVAPQPISNQNGRCGDNDYAHSIYMQESGCILHRENSIGACGLGQSLPCSKMSSACPDWRTNYDCQNQWFTNYAMSYGSWEAAYNFKYCLWTCYSTRTKTTVNKNGEPWW